jgi:hypothetical protein
MIVLLNGKQPSKQAASEHVAPRKPALSNLVSQPAAFRRVTHTR